MNSRLISYVDHGMRQAFASSPDGLAREVANYVSMVQELLLYDFNHSYVRDRSLTGDEGRLVEILQFSSAAEAVFYYRIGHAVYQENPQHRLLPYIASLMRIRTGAELYYSTEIGPGLNVQHGAGIVIGPRNIIGSHFTIHQGVTIGQGALQASEDSAVIGDHVTLYAGAAVVGKVHIGNHVWLGANAVLTKDAESNAVYAGVPARKIRTLETLSLGDRE